MTYRETPELLSSVALLERRDRDLHALGCGGEQRQRELPGEAPDVRGGGRGDELDVQALRCRVPDWDTAEEKGVTPTKKVIDPRRVETKKNPADIFTKAVYGETFRTLSEQLKGYAPIEYTNIHLREPMDD